MNQKIQAIRENVSRVLVGQEKVTDLLLTAMLAGGHVLLEDVPGMGKTVLARSVARSCDVSFGRVQFTPDLLPSDVTGLNVFDRGRGEFVFTPGPVFCSILLADEINRATPRTQSALLECMAEAQVTIDGVTRPLERPFLVIATQNPVETLGTYPLPEAQLDRFLMRVSMDPPGLEDEVAILRRFQDSDPLAALAPVCTGADVIALQEAARRVPVSEVLLRYIAQLCQASRGFRGVELGVSPRGSLALMRAAQAYALVGGENDGAFVAPEDIKAVAVAVLAHRLAVSAGSAQAQKDAVAALLESVPLPTENWGA